ncbi:MAG: hypothetical protein UV38_C0001G0147 [candidate division TM6 bacterium GW2011_GWE2_42_60]|nr:MAG: hypothetical protein UV38_C0001G0147 [candidate division TM6 bacterium GW2011_GWE2_42_60]HBY05657.1 hypothetical protein [Candidatus Dependentiae bacterium]
MRHQFRECGKHFLRIFLVGTGALLFACLYVQEDRELRGAVKQFLCDFFSKSYSCTMRARDVELDLLSGHIELKGVFAYGENWSWFAPSMGATWSWADTFSQRGFALSVAFKDVRVYSDADFSRRGIDIAFIPHVQQWLQPTSFPIKLEIADFALEGWGIFFESGASYSDRLLGVLRCSLGVSQINGEWQTKAVMYDGGIWRGEGEIVHSHTGKLLFCAPCDHLKPSHLHCVLTAQAQILISLFPALKISFDYQSGRWTYSLKNSGGKGLLSNLLCSGSVTQKEKKNLIEGRFKIQDNDLASFTGLYDQEVQKLSTHIAVKKIYALSDAYCLRDIAAESSWTFGLRTGAEEANTWKISAVLENRQKAAPKKHQSLPVTLYGTRDGGMWRTSCAALGEFLHIPGALFWQGSLAGRLGIGVRGISACIKLEKGQIPLPGTYAVINGGGLRARIDVRKKRVQIAHAWVETTRGSCSVKQGSVEWRQKKDGRGRTFYACLPWKVKILPFGSDSALSLRAVGAGALVILPNGSVRLTGLIACDQGRLEGNIFSALFIERLLGRLFYGADVALQQSAKKTLGATVRSLLSSAEFDLQVATEQPLEVDVPLLSGALKGRLHLQGTLGFPVIKGSLSLVDGVVHFPYRPLLVKQGDILFDLPHRPIPDLRFVAASEIKRHTVFLNAQGPLDYPSISLTSDPLLDERCCAMLLTGGTVDGTPALAYSASFKKLIHELFFADVLPDPLSCDVPQEASVAGLTLIPYVGSSLPKNASAGSAPGGRVGLVAEYGDQWSAAIEKNSECATATAAEIDYHLSPESLVFVNRDELGLVGIGGQWSHRWES